MSIQKGGCFMYFKLIKVKIFVIGSMVKNKNMENFWE